MTAFRPSADTSARRLAALSGLIAHAKKPHAAIVLVTVNAVLQKMAPQDVIESLAFSARPGNQVRMDDVAARLERNGFERVADRARSRRICGARRHSRRLRAGQRKSRSASISSAIRWKASAPSIRQASARPARRVRSTSTR